MIYSVRKAWLDHIRAEFYDLIYTKYVKKVMKTETLK